MGNKTFLDEYGFAATAKTALNLFEVQSRSSGRTSRMIERLRDGDRVLVGDQKFARWIEDRLAKVGKKDVKVLVVPPSQNPMERYGTSPVGRTFFDHTWIEAFFHRSLDNAARDLQYIQQAMSKDWPDQTNPLADKSGWSMNEFHLKTPSK